jgi:ADP-ribose pyrophosphatase YjhB (NUDIX family)
VKSGFFANNLPCCIKLAASLPITSQKGNLMQNTDMRPHWLELARRFQALAQNGLAYCKDPYDQERYEEIRHLAAEMMATCVGLSDSAAIENFFKNELGYATPKIDVRAAVFNKERVLLVRERKDDLWTLPGGWADVGDAPSASAIREVKEESGYDVVVKKLAALYDRDKHEHPPMPYHVYKMFFICELCGGAPVTTLETSGVDFFEENALPPLSLSRVTLIQIKHMFDHQRHPEWPTSFD